MFTTLVRKERSTFVTCLLFLLFHGLAAFQITGAGGLDGTSPGGERPLRYEIHDFAVSGASFDLYMFALQRFQSIPQDDPLSYFQIAGIHGFPQVTWDGVVGNGSYPGYCMHASVPFPAWHRPYMALFEQLVVQHAQDIATTYSDEQRDEYINASLTLRHPYWDWAVYPKLPDVVSQEQITLNGPNGSVTIANPLFKYIFQSGAAGNGFPSSDPMANFPETVRWWNGVTMSSNLSAANAALLANAPSIQSLVYQMLASVTNYTAMSCTYPGGQFATPNNIENIHNSIHNSIGGWGHMEFPEVAAFDPVFWLHHANVDRLFALWQALHPDSYMEPTINTYGSYYEQPGSVDSGSSALAPFYSDDGSTMFTTDDVRSTKTFDYTYPELLDWQMDSIQLAANVRKVANTLYGPSSNSTVRPSSGAIGERSSNFAESFGRVSLDLARELNVNNRDQQWSIAVLIDRFPLDTTFCIDFFMGEAPHDVASWPTAANLIGTYAQFNPANITLIHPNGFPAGQVHGEISMTHTLAAGVSRGALRNLTPRFVIPVLKRALTWRARTPAGDEIPLSSLSGLVVSVATRSVVPRTSEDQFPQFGAVQWLDAVTEGKPGGAGRRHKQT